MKKSERKVFVYMRVATQEQGKTSEQKTREKLLNDYRLRQIAGEHLPCPRCGRNTMDSESAMRNAYSRHADIYICNQCGLEEALNDFVGAVPEVERWSLFEIYK